MDTTRPTTAQLVRAIDLAFEILGGLVTTEYGYPYEVESSNNGKEAWQVYRRRMEALEAFVARVVERSDGIDSEDVEVVNNLMARNNAFDVIEGRKLLKELKGA